MRPFLVLAHPGHEIFLHAWMTRVGPEVHVLTDGRGRHGHARVDVTRSIVAKAGAVCGELFGSFTDDEVYGDLLAGRHGRLVDWAARLSRRFAEARAQLVVGDSLERQYLTHDVACLLAAAAARRLQKEGLPAPRRLAFPMYGFHGRPLDAGSGAEVSVELDDRELAAKRAASSLYLSTGAGIRSETEWFLETRGIEWFRRETLDDAARWERSAVAERGPRKWEDLGRRLVEDGVYATAIEYSRHVRPLEEALDEWADSPVAVSCAS